MQGTKVIWIVCGALALGAGAMVLTTSAKRPPGSPSVAPTASRDPATGAEAATAATAASAATAATPETHSTAAPVAPSTQNASTTPPPLAGTAAPRTRPAAPAAPIATAVRDADALDLGMDQKIEHATVVAGNIVRRKDPKTGKDFLLADGKYEIRGAGTKEDPYQVSWECLASASEIYLPRLHQNTMPQRIAMLNGAWIRVDGYMAFPLMVSETSELLLMLNQWDGCCIGVPPTPYDAMEVKLHAPVRRSSKHATFNFGGVEGRLKVEPYLVENWLAGLYLLEDGSLRVEAQPEF